MAGSQQPSSTLASTIISNARNYLNDAGTAQFWNDAELLQWLNDGTIDMVTRSHCLENTESINLIASQVEYTPSENYIEIKAVQYINASGDTIGLLPGKPTDVGRVENVKEPAYWYDFDGKAGVYPALSSVTSESINIFVVNMPPAVLSAEAITTPAIYDKALTMYIVAQAWVKDRQTGKYAQAMGIYHAELDRYRQDFLTEPEEPAR